MIQTSLAALTPDELRDAFNLVYTGYVISLQETTAGIEARFTATDIDRAHSLLWRADDGQVIGLAALGVRGERGWVGGFGIAPTYRGGGLSHTLIHATLAEARTIGLAQVQLEVLSGNVAAIRTYERAGFTRTRELLVWERGGDVAESASQREAVLQPLAAPDLLPRLAEWQSAPPSWQREAASLRQTANLTGWALKRDGIPVAGLLARIGDEDARIAEIAGNDASALADLVAHFAKYHASKRLLLVNEPESSSLNTILPQLGWRTTLRQHEMLVRLA